MASNNLSNLPPSTPNSNSSSSSSSDSEIDILPPSASDKKRSPNIVEWEVQSDHKEFLSGGSKSKAGSLLGQGRAAVPVRRYTCEDCGEAFAKASALAEHIVSPEPSTTKTLFYFFFFCCYFFFSYFFFFLVLKIFLRMFKLTVVFNSFNFK